MSSQGNLFRGKPLWVEIQLPPRFFFQGELLLWRKVASKELRWVSDKGHSDNQREYWISKALSSEWDLLNSQQKIKWKMWKFWGLYGRMLPWVSGVCSCRSVITILCLCWGFRSAVTMCYWKLQLLLHCQGDQEFCWWCGSDFGEGEGSCWF